MRDSVSYTFPDPSFRHSKWKHRVHLFIMTVAVVGISGVAIFYSLGYQVNWYNYTIRRTGLITLDSVANELKADIIINGTQVASVFPYRSDPLFPDSYRIQVKKDGYQEWERTVNVEENEVTAFNSVVIILKKPDPHQLTEGDRRLFSTPTSVDRAGIEVRDNELYINGAFITRTSHSILNATWYPDRQHIIYQSGDELLLADRDGLHTQLLYTSQTQLPVSYKLADHGRILLYQDGNSSVRGLELF
jgi:hypothetical protein